jgi:hypothetical protein
MKMLNLEQMENVNEDRGKVIGCETIGYASDTGFQYVTNNVEIVLISILGCPKNGKDCSMLFFNIFKMIKITLGTLKMVS